MRRFAALLLSVLATAGASADEWRMLDAGKLLFEPTWEGQAVPGRFESFDVCIDTAEGGIAGSTLTVTVQLASADMDDPDINEAIADAEWFAVDEFPVARFASDTIEAAEEGGYVAAGHLELKGVRLPVDVPFQWTESEGRAEMRGELVIDRTRFEVGSGEWASGDTIGTAVRVSFDLTLERQ